MKKPLLFTIFMAIALFGMAQTVVFSDNFDSYTAGSYLAQSNSAWTTWQNLPGSSEDGVITSAQAASAPNSLYISGSNDQVYPFGNYTTGHYTIAFNYYVPSTGNGAYFNIQHVLLQQWAFECYFYNTGSGYVSVNNTTYQFTYSCDTWFPILVDVDMDIDQVSLTINNTLVQTWAFSSTTADPGVNQLAGINFYAGSPSNNLSGTYYVDDFVVTELNAALIGEFAVSPDSLYTTIAPDASDNLSLTLSNPGTGTTDYLILPTYDIPDPVISDVNPVELQHFYFSDVNPTFIGFSSGHTYEIAIGLPADMLLPHIGKALREIYFYMPSGITNAKVEVFNMKHPLLDAGPGDLIREQTFVPDSGWNYVELDQPVIIDGSTLWVGIWIEQPAGVYPIGLDGNTANDYSAWYRGVPATTWSSATTSSVFGTYQGNLLIGAVVTGDPITPWINISPLEGTLQAGGNLNQTVTVSASGMNTGEVRTAKLHCYSSDINNREVIVPVTLSTTEVSVNEHNQIEVSVYPNPSSDYLNLSADLILRVEVFNMAGQKVLDNTCNDSHVVIPTSNLTAGTYLVTVTTNSGKTSKKVIIR